MDDFPVPDTMVIGAIRSPTFRAQIARLNDKIADNKIADIDGGKVDGQAG